MTRPKAQHGKTTVAKPAAGATRKRSNLVRRVTRGTLIAVGLTAVQFVTPEAAQKWELFDSGLVDSLHAPLTRFHE
ncbi:MAG: hypothetical protein JSS11_06495 [Verrucomicrobia bacterium]|nr:hypothetical protein [Verrucomicrobiota bacterium]